MRRSIAGLVEFFCVAALLTLLGAGAFSLVSVGASAYANLSESREHISDLRVASSFISMKVRRHDEAGAASVRMEGTGNVLVLTSLDEDGEVAEVRIYLYDGMLREAICSQGDPFEPELGLEVVPLEGYEVAAYGDRLTFSLERAELRREFNLRLRSGGQGHPV